MSPSGFPAQRTILSVSQLNTCARSLLEDVFGHLWVEGEISNLSQPASGHLYFSLKDSHAQIRCALFKPQALHYRTQLKNGQNIQAYGRVSLFEGRGDYQLIVEQVSTTGEGPLQQAFEQLKRQLAAEGLFDSEHKKALPTYPQRIGIISSPTGAVIHDIASVFERRAPQVALVLVPTPVQGSEASSQILKAIRLADRQGFDALILARGGGSLEDLWCFNEERVVRAVAACHTPIISAIGHETDVTLSDFAADVRAPTPSAAAELLAPQRQHLLDQIRQLQQRLRHQILRQLQQHQQQLTALSQGLQHPHERLKGQKQQLLQLQQRLWLSGQTQIEHRQLQLQHLAQQLHTLSPLATLSRGYSLLLDAQGQVIRHACQTTAGQYLTARLAQSQLTLRVESAMSEHPSPCHQD